MCHMDNTCAAAPFQSRFVLFLTNIPFFFCDGSSSNSRCLGDSSITQILEKLVLVAHSNLESHLDQMKRTFYIVILTYTCVVISGRRVLIHELCVFSS